MPLSNREFDHRISQQLRELPLELPTELWSNIEIELHKPDKRKNPLWLGILSATFLLLLVAFSLHIIHSKLQLSGKTDAPDSTAAFSVSQELQHNVAKIHNSTFLASNSKGRAETSSSRSTLKNLQSLPNNLPSDSGGIRNRKKHSNTDQGFGKVSMLEAGRGLEPTELPAQKGQELKSSSEARPRIELLGGSSTLNSIDFLATEGQSPKSRIELPSLVNEWHQMIALPNSSKQLLADSPTVVLTNLRMPALRQVVAPTSTIKNKSFWTVQLATGIAKGVSQATTSKYLEERDFIPSVDLHSPNALILTDSLVKNPLRPVLRLQLAHWSAMGFGGEVNLGIDRDRISTEGVVSQVEIASGSSGSTLERWRGEYRESRLWLDAGMGYRKEFGRFSPHASLGGGLLLGWEKLTITERGGTSQSNNRDAGSPYRHQATRVFAKASLGLDYRLTQKWALGLDFTYRQPGSYALFGLRYQL